MGNAKKRKKLKFKYVIPDKLPDYYVNGAFGGITPREEIHMHFFSERNPIPKELTLSLGENGDVTPEETEKIVGGDVVRLVQASIIMDVGTAIAIRDWMNERINFILEAKEDKKKPAKKKSDKKRGK